MQQTIEEKETSGLVFIMIKTWALHEPERILEELEKVGKRIKAVEIPAIPLERILQQYAEHYATPYFASMISDHIGRRAIIAIYEGEIEAFTSAKKRIREKFSGEVLSHPFYKRDPLHTSDSSEEFLKDIQIWEDYL